MARTKKKVAKKAAKKSATKKKTAKKKVVKKASKKKATPKKKVTAKKKATAKKKPAKKASKKPVAKKKTSKKSAAKKVVKKAAKKAPSKKKATKKASARVPAGDFPTLNQPRKVPRVELSHGSDPIQLHHRKPSAKDIAGLRNMLIERRKQLYGDVTAMESEAFSDSTREISSNHIADSSADQYEQDFTLHMIESETTELRQIELTLGKIDRGEDYGRCENCDIWISIERLKAKPFARICIHCIEKFEEEGGGEAFGISSVGNKY